ncbi:LuxR C-terminal-related transcriptional regulator [Nocardioides bruguierae]|uniref:LuxR C-terminal-related transcriptional regulator n=1 Tax=Nocardioides bruguierae TaxID=2945102 RepID=UPI0020228FC2|nr:LuxR C-terminal-related transcriptional regulator [Nocardioides bruguierae]MCL8026417.1 LuxR C-terminal-related transcriptional regulator [Nocardioides bruguierae]
MTSVAERTVTGAVDLGWTVPRPRLEARVDVLLAGGASWATRCRALHVTAPQGSGKSVLARAWAARARRAGWSVALLDLGAAQGETSLLARRLLVAVAEAGPAYRAAVTDLGLPTGEDDTAWVVGLVGALERAHAVTIGSVTGTDLGEADGAEDPLTAPGLLLVLDGLHRLACDGATRQVDLLLRLAPRSVRFVLLGRRPADLPAVLDLAVAGRLQQLSAHDLAFTPEELAAVCPTLGPEQVDEVLAETQGWPVLARTEAAARSLPEPTGDAWRLLGRDVVTASLADWLGPEPLAEPVRDVLRAAAVDEEVPLALLVAVSGRADAGALLDRLSAHCCLVSRGVGSMPRYRLHAAVRSHVEAEHACADLADLRRRHAVAARWFADGPDGADGVAGPADPGAGLAALRHAVRSGEHDLVGEVLREIGPRLVNEGRSEDLLTVLPAETPGPLAHCVRARALLEEGHAAEARVLLDGLDLADVGDDHDLAVLTEALRTDLERVVGVRVSAPAVAPLGSRPDVRLQHDLARVNALLRAGRLDEAERALVGVRRQALGLDRAGARVAAEETIALLAAARSDARGAAAAAREGLTVASRHGWSRHRRTAHLHLLAGWAARSRLDEDAARVHAGLAVEMLDDGHDATVRLCVAALAAVTGLDGDAGGPVDAERLHRVWESLLDEVVAPEAVVYVAMASVYVSLATNRPERVREAIGVLRDRLGDVGEVDVAVAAADLLRGQRRRAHAALGPVAGGTRACAVPGTQVEAAALLVRLELEDDNHARARERCRALLEVADRLGLPRPLLDLGGPLLLGLLREGRGGWGAREGFVGSLLARSGPLVGPVVPLTERELDVLRELPTLATVEEMADALVVSVNTVKTHLRGVYRKLGVSSRRDAVQEARRAGLL